MKVIGTRDEITMLKMTCQKQGECDHCVLEPFCDKYLALPFFFCTEPIKSQIITGGYMHNFVKTVNGHTLKIRLDEERLFELLDKETQRMEILKKDIEEAGGEAAYAAKNNEDPDDCVNSYMADYRYEYDLQTVHGDPYTDFCTPDEVIADIKEFKETIEKIIADNGSTLWDMVQFKKNGTFKKTAKPIIRTAINGSYFEDDYGWDTIVLRIVPKDDTSCSVELDSIIVHY